MRRRGRKGGALPRTPRGAWGSSTSVFLLLASPAFANTDVVGVRGADVLVSVPPAPRAAIVMLPGGTGVIGFGPDEASFVVRARARWLARGDAVLIPAAPAGVNERGSRSTPGFASFVGLLVGLAQARVPGVPVVVFGTSQGAIGAVNGAAHARPGSVALVVLSEAVSRPGRRSAETVFDADPAGVHAPVLVVADGDDRCPVAPPRAAPRIAAALTGSPRVELLRLAGGDTRSPDPCSSRTPHGYWGIGARAVHRIGTAIDAMVAPAQATMRPSSR